MEPSEAESNCTNRTVNEAVLEDVTVKALNRILRGRKEFLTQLQENVARAVVTTDTLSPEGIQLRLEDLQKELLRKVEGGKDYNAITDEMVRLQEMKKQSTVDNHRREEAMNRIKELQDFVAMQNTEIHVFDEALVRKLIKSIMVYADKFTVEFKSGISVDIAE